MTEICIMAQQRVNHWNVTKNCDPQGTVFSRSGGIDEEKGTTKSKYVII